MSDDSTGSPNHRYPSNGVQGRYSAHSPRQMNSAPDYQLGGATLENGHIPSGTALGHREAPNDGGRCGGGSSKELPQRYVLVFMSFLAFVNIYMMYLNLSVALPAMVDHNATKLKTLDDQKGVFFDNSELVENAYEQLNDSLSNKREKRQRNASEDDLFYLSGENNIDSKFQSNDNSHMSTTVKDEFSTPLVNNFSSVTKTPSMENTSIVSNLDVAQPVTIFNISSERENSQMELNYLINNTRSSNKVGKASEANNITHTNISLSTSNSYAHGNTYPNFTNANDNVDLPAIENSTNSEPSTEVKKTADESAVFESTVLASNGSGNLISSENSNLDSKNSKRQGWNVSVIDDSSISLTVVASTQKSNVSLAEHQSELNSSKPISTASTSTEPSSNEFSSSVSSSTESSSTESSSTAIMNHNINLNIDSNGNIGITFNKANANGGQLKLEAVIPHTQKNIENTKYDITDLENKTLERVRREISELEKNISDDIAVTMPSFHVAEIVPVTQRTSAEIQNTDDHKTVQGTSAQSTVEFSNAEVFETTSAKKLDEESKNTINQLIFRNSSINTNNTAPETTTEHLNNSTLSIVMFSPIKTEVRFNHSDTTPNYVVEPPFSVETQNTVKNIDTSKSQTLSSEEFVDATTVESYVISTTDEVESTTTFDTSVNPTNVKTSFNKLINESNSELANETFDKSSISANFNHSIMTNLSSTLTSVTSDVDVTLQTILETTLDPMLNESVHMEDVTTPSSVTEAIGEISPEKDFENHSMISEVTNKIQTILMATTDTSVLKFSTIKSDSTIPSSEIPEISTENPLIQTHAKNLTLPVDQLNLFSSDIKENLIKDTTLPSNEGVINAENFITEGSLARRENNRTKTDAMTAIRSRTPIGNITNESSSNDSLHFVVPLSIPCQSFMYVNCSITGRYHVIDKKGMDDMTSHESDWVTLQPLPQSDDPYFKDRHHSNEEEEEDDDDESKEVSKLIKMQKYNFTDNFNLSDCHINHGNNSEDSDIQCISSLGLIKLNIIDESDGSSSSSSSSSSEEDEVEGEGSEQENEEEEDEGEEEEEEEGEDEEADDERKSEDGLSGLGRWSPFNGNYRRVPLRKKVEEKNEDNENEGKNRNEEKNENKEGNLEEEEGEETEKEETKSHKLKNFRNKNKECEESSEECDEEEEEEEEEEEGEGEEGEGEGEEEEQDENELTEEFAGPASGQIKLEGKIPSTVCFYKRLPELKKVQFLGYEDGEYKWQPDLQNRIIGAYYWGFLISQIPAGRLSAMVGGKLLLLFGVLMAGIITLFTPLLASAGPYWLLTARVILGMMQGICMPATQALLAKWAPPLERTRMVAFTYSGIAVGAAMGGPLSAYLVQEIGWRTLCYGQGAIALIWSALWFLLIAESPSTHPRITNKEKEYVIGSIGYQHAGVGIPVPWCSILRSRHVLALMLAQGSYIWAWHTLLHYAPKYIATVLHDDLSVVQSVWASAMACMFVATCAYGAIADWLRKTRRLSTISVRRAANSICSILTAGFLVGVAQSYCNREAVKVCFAFAIAMGFPGAFSGIFANSLDLAPNHAGAITGLCGAFATTASILAPYYWSLIVSGRQTLERWRTIWYTCAIFLLLANCLYFLLVGTKEQRWNRALTLNKLPKNRDEEHEIVMPRRRANQTHGMKTKMYASTEHL